MDEELEELRRELERAIERRSKARRDASSDEHESKMTAAVRSLREKIGRINRESDEIEQRGRKGRGRGRPEE